MSFLRGPPLTRGLSPESPVSGAHSGSTESSVNGCGPRPSRAKYARPIATSPPRPPASPSWTARSHRRGRRRPPVFPSPANRIVHIAVENFPPGSRIGFKDRLAIPKQPSFALLDGETEACPWSRGYAPQQTKQIAPKRLPTPVVKVANNDNGYLVFRGVVGVRMSISSQEPWKLVEQHTLARISLPGEIGGNPSHAPVRDDPECVLLSFQLRHNDIKGLLSGLVLDQDFEVHPIPLHPDSRWTIALPTEALLSPDWLSTGWRLRAAPVRNRPLPFQATRPHLDQEHRRGTVGES